MANERFESVWDAIADSSVESANLKLRSELMQQLKAVIDEKGLSPTMLARKYGVLQTRIDDLMHGRISKFSLDDLVDIRHCFG